MINSTFLKSKKGCLHRRDAASYNSYQIGIGHECE